jgi:hypothetical protein
MLYSRVVQCESCGVTFDLIWRKWNIRFQCFGLSRSKVVPSVSLLTNQSSKLQKYKKLPHLDHFVFGGVAHSTEDSISCGLE